MNGQVVLGIDIGGTNTVYGLISKDGEVVHHESIPTNGSLPIADLLDRLESKVNEALSSFPEIEEIIGVGIGAPNGNHFTGICLLYTSPSPRDRQKSRMPSSA